MFLILLAFAFNGVYRMVQKLIKRRLIQLAYGVSLLFILVTIALTACYWTNSTAFYIFLTVGLTYWIIYFGYTPKWSPYFMLTFLFVFPALVLVDNLLMNSSISMIKLNTENTSGIYLGEVPIEAMYLSLLVTYLSTLLYEVGKNKKST